MRNQLRRCNRIAGNSTGYGDETRRVPNAGRAKLWRGTAARRRRHPARRPETTGRHRDGAGCTSDRARAFILDATSTGTLQNSAGLISVRSRRRDAKWTGDFHHLRKRPFRPRGSVRGRSWSERSIHRIVPAGEEGPWKGARFQFVVKLPSQ